ncbi:ABC transporter ATP-binding protein [Desulforamulus ruminis]|uniref:ABC transporter ATP-binding protein n=1 Tax=Desulforamulus ruminis TaxID=1564 RepID=UPI002FD90287
MFRILKRIFNLAGERRKNLQMAFLMNFLENLCKAVPIVVLLLTLNDLVSGTLSTRVLGQRLVTMLLGLVGQYVFNLLVFIYQSGTGFEIIGEQRIIIGERLKRLPMGFFSNTNVGNITSVVTSDLSFVEMLSMQFVSKVIDGFISSLMIILILFLINWKMAVIAILGYPIAFLINKKIQSSFKKFAPQRQRAQGEVTSKILEYIQGITVIKACNLSGTSFKKLDEVLSRFKKLALDFEMKAVPWAFAYQACFQICIGLILFFGPYYYFAGELSLSALFMFMIISFMVYAPAETLMGASGLIRLMDVCLDRVEGVWNIPLLDEKEVDRKINSYEIEFKNVSFAYGNREVLKNISFKVPERTMTAIVGPSGSGKTTITNLIARFWDVQKGEVLLGGVNVKEMKCESVLSHISMVFQNVYLFNDTILNNIRIGNPEAPMGKVIEAAQKAGCHEFIGRLEKGYDTLVGEGGSTLSGGEKQRISIARAILKDAPIVLLDEATASVDPEKEKLIHAALNSLVKNKTLVVIAHRLSTIKNADQILVLSREGEMAEKGTHQELLERNNLYADFWQRRQKARNWRISSKCEFQQAVSVQINKQENKAAK